MKRKSGRQLIQQGCTTLVKRKQIVITVVLLTAQLLLLFGIFSQLPAPGPTSLERDTTAVDYNTFLAQVRAGNVLVASLHDQEMVGALVRPLTEGQKTSSSRTMVTQQQAISYLNAWYYTPSGDVPGQGIGAATASPPLQSVQLISTRLPESGDAELMPLLLGKHVVIKVQLAMQPPRWLSQIWKLLPCLLLLLMLPQFLFPSKRVRFPGAPGDFISFRSTRNQTEAERQNAPAPKAHLKGASAGDKVVRARASSQVFPELEPPQITFADVAGIDQVRQEVQELVQFLRAPPGRRVAGRSPWHGQNAARQSCRGRSGGTFLQRECLGVRRNVRGDGGEAGTRAVLQGA